MQSSVIKLQTFNLRKNVIHIFLCQQKIRITVAPCFFLSVFCSFVSFVVVWKKDLNCFQINTSLADKQSLGMKIARNIRRAFSITTVLKKVEETIYLSPINVKNTWTLLLKVFDENTQSCQQSNAASCFCFCLVTVPHLLAFIFDRIISYINFTTIFHIKQTNTILIGSLVCHFQQVTPDKHDFGEKNID